jgi:hypothetical protein
MQTISLVANFAGVGFLDSCSDFLCALLEGVSTGGCAGRDAKQRGLAASPGTVPQGEQELLRKVCVLL